MKQAIKIFGAVALAVAMFGLAPGCTTPPEKVNTKSPLSASANVVGIGTAVRDGSFEMTVQSVECGKFQLGVDWTVQKSQGQFCIVKLKIRNIGQAADVFNDSAQGAIGAKGEKYASNSQAGLAASEGSTPPWFTPINPGNEINGLIVFDIPKDARIDFLDLHDSVFSGGVRVRNAS